MSMLLDWDGKTEKMCEAELLLVWSTTRPSHSVDDREPSGGPYIVGMHRTMSDREVT